MNYTSLSKYRKMLTSEHNEKPGLNAKKAMFEMKPVVLINEFPFLDRRGRGG